MAEISILVPVYNVEKYLSSCLDSILAQTFTDFEVICMDDGSTDKSGELLDAYAQNDERIKVIHKANSGYGNTMNMALQMSTGNYVGIVESDDTIEGDMYQVLHHFATEFDLDFVKTDHYCTWDNEDGTLRKEYCSLTDDNKMYNRVLNPNEELQSYLLQKFTWNALYKRSFLLENKIRYNETPGASYQDNGFWFQTFYWSKRVMFLDRAFYNYRQDNAFSSIHSKQKVYAMKDEFDFIRNMMIMHKDKRKELYKICFHLRMRGYLSTLGRIDRSLKMDFAQTIQDECAFFEQQGEAYYDWLTEKQAQIIRNPVAYVEEVAIGFQQITKERIAGFRNIIIYGAGIYGERAVCRVRMSKTEDQSIQVAVTELSGSSSMQCQGERVCEIADCIADKDASLVILAVKEDSDAFKDMLDCLRKYRFPHIISVSAKRLG